jgi:NADH:ubiquinone oxidoreductase subunit 6 (subunit J)
LELTLNLVWLVLCLLLLAVLGPAVKAPLAGRTRVVAAVALVCILFLLFPVISMSDDLHNNPAMLEGSKLKKLALASHAVAALLTWAVVQASPKAVVWPISGAEKTSTLSQIAFTTSVFRRPPPAILSA